MKIVYCLNRIRGLGGIENVTLHKANALADISGNEVYILITEDTEEDVLLSPFLLKFIW